MLHAERQGAGLPVVLVHGFTQTAASWPKDVVDRLAATGHEVIAIDAPGHGRSAGTQADLPTGAGLMVAAATLQAPQAAHAPQAAQAAQAAQTAPATTRTKPATTRTTRTTPATTRTTPATWIGYSMGGRYALYAALDHPQAVERLVLVSTTAGIDDDRDRAARRQADDALAVRIETEGVGAFVEWWLETPLFKSLPAEASRREDRLTNTAAGLASSLRRAGAGTMEPPLWSRLKILEMPVLIVAGDNDPKYAALADRLAEGIGPNAIKTLIPGAGHACHLERPAAFLDAIERFLAETH